MTFAGAVRSVLRQYAIVVAAATHRVTSPRHGAHQARATNTWVAGPSDIDGSPSPPCPTPAIDSGKSDEPGSRPISQDLSTPPTTLGEGKQGPRLPVRSLAQVSQEWTMENEIQLISDVTAWRSSGSRRRSSASSPRRAWRRGISNCPGSPGRWAPGRRPHRQAPRSPPTRVAG